MRGRPLCRWLVITTRKIHALLAFSLKETQSHGDGHSAHGGFSWHQKAAKMTHDNWHNEQRHVCVWIPGYFPRPRPCSKSAVSPSWADRSPANGRWNPLGSHVSQSRHCDLPPNGTYPPHNHTLLTKYTQDTEELTPPRSYCPHGKGIITNSPLRDHRLSYSLVSPSVLHKSWESCAFGQFPSLSNHIPLSQNQIWIV